MDFSWVASQGINVIGPPVINNFMIMLYTLGWSQYLLKMSLRLQPV